MNFFFLDEGCRFCCEHQVFQVKEENKAKGITIFTVPLKLKRLISRLLAPQSVNSSKKSKMVVIEEKPFRCGVVEGTFYF